MAYKKIDQAFDELFVLAKARQLTSELLQEHIDTWGQFYWCSYGTYYYPSAYGKVKENAVAEFELVADLEAQ